MKRLLLSAMLPFTLATGFDTAPSSRAFDPKYDDVADLAPLQKVERSLHQIGPRTSGRVAETAWSDRAWDHNRALMNERYTEKNFTKLGGWPARRAFLERWNAEIAASLPNPAERRRAIGTLSPAEKYDLVMGTVRGGLADANRDKLNEEGGAKGKFPTWWGICEGSAAASLASPEPTKIVWVRSEPYKVDVPFYAPDIKALVSLLWSSYNAMLKLPEIGRQCDDKGGGACADVNPASFHRALHHFIGLGQGHLVADVDATRVVWNHPLQGYETFYYPANLGPKSPSPDFEAALSRADRVPDPRRKLRAPGTVYIVGVVTKLFYGDNVKNHPLEGSVKRKVLSVSLQYELELDEDYNILGGEWISKKHPDLLWTIPRGMLPGTPGDSQLGSATWDGLATPRAWESAARLSAQKMMPLRKVVDGLVRRSAE